MSQTAYKSQHENDDCLLKLLNFAAQYIKQIYPLKIINQMLKAQFRQLRKNGVTELCQTSVQQESVIVQAYNIALGKNDKLFCLISDGKFCIKAFFKEKNILIPEKHQYAIIRINQHVVADSGRKLGIISFDIVCEYSEVIGSPIPLDLQNLPNPEEIKAYEIQLKKIKTKHINMIEEKTRVLTDSHKNTLVKKEEAKIEEKREMRIPDAKPLNGSVKDYETIKGLFIGLKNWHLLCRVTKLDYQEFQKKNSDKLVRVLNIQLMDRSDVKISGAFFYEAADKFKDYLKLNSVYKISDGTITNQSYNNSKNEKLSPFRLMFNVNSVFEQVSDVNIIAKSQDSAITLNQLLNRSILSQQFDIVGILVAIEQPKQITKGDKLLTRWLWVVADPIQHKRIHAVLWNDRIKPDSSLVGKTIIFNRFSLNNYNGSLTLSSKTRSSIQPAYNHAYRDYEDEVMRNSSSYELLSEMRMKEQDSTTVVYKNFKQLSAAIDNLNSGESMKSDLDIFVSRLFMKKWFYEGCPNCNKSAEKATSCNCGKYVEQTIPHFILGVQLADAYGSVYSTAYDDQAIKIFWNEEGVIHKLMKMDQKQLKDIVEDYFFQQFKLRLYTKKDGEGKIKHNMGRLQPLAPEKCAMQNLQKIKELMGNMMN